jgi:group I intron endonuclease
MVGIYKITNQIGGIYIGQSKNIEKRFKYYYTISCKGQRKVYNSLILYGYKNHTFEVLKECLIEDLDELESYYINIYNSFDSELGLNLDSGSFNKKMSKETKQKLSNSLKGRVFTQEWKDKIGLKSIGRMIGYKHSEESILKMKNSVRKKHSKPNAKKGTGYSEEEAMIRHREACKKYRLKMKSLLTLNK